MNTVYALIDIECESEREFGFDRIAMRIAQFSQVLDVAVVSGRSDLTVKIEAQSVEEISRFVTETLAPMERVSSTATHFFMKQYKHNGELLEIPHRSSRIPVSP